MSAGELDALCVPGGWAPDKIRRDKGIIKLVHDLYNQGKIVGLICHAGLVGISAQIVKGKKATGSEGIKDDLINAGAQWVDEPAFRDGNIVWGRVVKDIPDYCRVLVSAISGEFKRGQYPVGADTQAEQLAYRAGFMIKSGGRAGLGGPEGTVGLTSSEGPGPIYSRFSTPEGG